MSSSIFPGDHEDSLEGMPWSSNFAAQVNESTLEDERKFQGMLGMMGGLGGNQYAGHAPGNPVSEELKAMTNRELVKKYRDVFNTVRVVNDSNRGFILRKLQDAEDGRLNVSTVNPLGETVADRDVRSVAQSLSIPGAATVPIHTLRGMIKIATVGKTDNDRYWSAGRDRTFLVPDDDDDNQTVMEKQSKARTKAKLRAAIQADSGNSCERHSEYDPMVERFTPGLLRRKKASCENETNSRYGCVPVDGKIHPFTCKSALDEWLTGATPGAHDVVTRHSKTGDIVTDDNIKSLFDELYPVKNPDGPLMTLRKGFSGVWGEDTSFSFQRLSLFILSLFMNQSDVDDQIKEDGGGGLDGAIKGKELFRNDHYTMVEELWNSVEAPLIRAMIADPRYFERMLPTAIHSATKRYLAADVAELEAEMLKYRDSTDLAARFLDATGLGSELDSGGDVATAKVVAFLAVKSVMERVLGAR